MFPTSQLLPLVQAIEIIFVAYRTILASLVALLPLLHKYIHHESVFGVTAFFLTYKQYQQYFLYKAKLRRTEDEHGTYKLLISVDSRILSFLIDTYCRWSWSQGCLIRIEAEWALGGSNLSLKMLSKSQRTTSKKFKCDKQRTTKKEFLFGYFDKGTTYCSSWNEKFYFLIFVQKYDSFITVSKRLFFAETQNKAVKHLLIVICGTMRFFVYLVLPPQNIIIIIIHLFFLRGCGIATGACQRAPLQRSMQSEPESTLPV